MAIAWNKESKSWRVDTLAEKDALVTLLYIRSRLLRTGGPIAVAEDTGLRRRWVRAFRIACMRCHRFLGFSVTEIGQMYNVTVKSVNDATRQVELESSRAAITGEPMLERFAIMFNEVVQALKDKVPPWPAVCDRAKNGGASPTHQISILPDPPSPTLPIPRETQCWTCYHRIVVQKDGSSISECHQSRPWYGKDGMARWAALTQKDMENGCGQHQKM